MAHRNFALFERELFNFTDTPSIQIDSSLELDVPYIVSAVVETGLYGLLLILAPLTLYVLVKRPEQSSLSSSTYTDKIVTIVCGAQFGATTVHWILSLRFAFSVMLAAAHTTYTISVENGQLRILEQVPSYLHNLSTIAPLNAKLGVTTIQLFLGDCLIIYRMYLVWMRRRRVIIFPILSIMGVLAFGILDAILPYGSQWNFSLLLSSLLTNVYASCMIGYRIWKNSRNLMDSGVAYSLNFIKIGIECAGLYTLALIIATAISIPALIIVAPTSGFYTEEILNYNILTPLVDSLGVILSISLCLLVLRVKLFGQAYRERNVRTISDWQARSNPPETGDPCEIRMSAVGPPKNDHEPRVLRLSSSSHSRRSSSSEQLTLIT